MNMVVVKISVKLKNITTTSGTGRGRVYVESQLDTFALRQFDYQGRSIA
jgi:hypothetical protein